MDLRGLVLITGGSSGIGKQLAADFLRAGAYVVVVANEQTRLECARRDLSAISGRIDAVECDVAETASVERMRKVVLARHGPPDILINNAGFATYRTVEESALEELERLVAVNFLGALRCTKAFLPAMIERRRGGIVNVSSIAGRLIITPNGTYCAAKHALVAWSEVLKYELARFNIQVNVICPGRVETPFFDHETFVARSPRPETRYTVGLAEVSRATLAAVRRNRFMTYTPRTLGWFVWLVNAFPYVLKPAYGQLLLRRIDSLYRR